MIRWDRYLAPRANISPAGEVPDDQHEEGEEEDGADADEDHQDEAEELREFFI